jgi:acyl-homoserine lactone acylase PvdQ
VRFQRIRLTMNRTIWTRALVAGLTLVIASCAKVPVGPPATSSAELFRDRYGIAHVYADTEEEGYYGVGYALAEDRLLQVLTWYLAVRGELARTFGKETPRLFADIATPLADAVASDMVALKYRYLEVARRNFDQLPAQFQKNVRAYLDGLQAYMAEHPEHVPAWAPPLEPALPLALFHFFVQEARQICPARRQFDPASARQTATIVRESPFQGSNAWVVGGRRSADGGVMFSADSHGLIDTHGTVFYPYRVKAGRLDFLAFEPTGTATLLFGHSSRFAWGVTEGPRFVGDCYRVRLGASDPATYEYDGKPQRIEQVPYSIEVKGASPVTGVFEYTRHNGVRSPVEERTADTVYVVSYAHAERLGLGSGQYYQMARARTRAEFEAAMATGDLYPANHLAGGADGTILYIRPGGIPIRPAELDVRGTLDGNTSATAWQGMHSYGDLLKLVNPRQGYIVNTNASPDMMYAQSPMQQKDYPPYFAFESGRTNERQRRLLEILDGNTRMTVEQATNAVMDETIPAARQWGPLLHQALAAVPVEASLFAAEVPGCVSELARFDGGFTKDSRAALAHIELLLELGRRREMYDRLVKAMESRQSPQRALQEFLVDGAHAACVNVRAKYGRADATLGDVYRVGRGGVDLPIGSGRVPGPGVATVRGLRFGPTGPGGIQRLTGGQRAPFLVHFGPDGVRSYAQVLFGVSDRAESPHFSDQAQLASDKLLPEVPLTREALVRSGAKAQRLQIGPRYPGYASSSLTQSYN